MASWEDLRAGWAAVAASADAAWQSAYTAATAAWGELIEETPERYADEVHGFLVLLDEWDQYLRAGATLVGQLPAAERAAWSSRLTSSREEWRYFGAGIYPYVEVESGDFKPGVGAVQVLIGVAVVAVAIAGVAWAVAYYQEAKAKRDWAFYSLEELAGRIKALDAGTTLQPYTGPAQPPTAQPPTAQPSGPNQNVSGWGVAAGFGLVLLAGFGVYAATRPR